MVYETAVRFVKLFSSHIAGGTSTGQAQPPPQEINIRNLSTRNTGKLRYKCSKIKRCFTQSGGYMRSPFKRFRVSIRLMYAGWIILPVLAFLAARYYLAREAATGATRSSLERIERADQLTRLIYQLGRERDASYRFALSRDSFSRVLLQWPLTNTLVQVISSSHTPGFAEFDPYPFKKRLNSLRDDVEAVYGYPADSVMAQYSALTAELISLNVLPAGGLGEAGLSQQDLAAQHGFLEMVEKIDVLRTAIYGMLFTGPQQPDSVQGGASELSSFAILERNYLGNASAAVADAYRLQKTAPEVAPMLTYMNHLITTRQADSVYDAAAWLAVSDQGLEALKAAQQAVLQKAGATVARLLQRDQQSASTTFGLLLAALLAPLLLAVYTVLRALSARKAPAIPVGMTAVKESVPPGMVRPSIEPGILISPPDPGDRMIPSAPPDGETHEKFAPVPAHHDNGASRPAAVEKTPEPGRQLSQKLKDDVFRLMLEKDKVRAEIDDLLKWKEDYLSVASHELKTPVASLKAYTHLLQNDAHEKGDLTKEGMYAKMDLQVDKLNQLVNDLLDTTKIQNGKLAFHSQHFSLDRLIHQTVEEIQSRHPSHQIVMEKNPPVHLFADRDRIAQVMAIVLHNAIRFCPDVPLIIVRSEVIENKVVCSVQDFGRGIGKQHQHKIFEEFYRVDEPNAPATPGLGLGLFIAREVIAAHKGRMWLKSREDEGSTFYFSLPVAKDRPE